MRFVRLSVLVAGSFVVLFSAQSPAQAHFRSGRIFRTPSYCTNPSQSCFVQETCGAVASCPTVDAGVCSGAGCNWSNECSGGCSQVHDAVVETGAPPLLHEGSVIAPLVQGTVHHDVIHAGVMHAPIPPHPIYSYMAAGPYYYGVPHYYDPSWDAGRVATTQPNVRRGPVAKGRSEAYPALPYSEFAAQQATDSANVDNTRAQIVVRVPNDDARVFIDGQLMKTAGRVRTFSTPPLVRGRSYEIEIRGEWQGDEPHTKRIEVRAGQTQTVELGR